MASSAQEFVDHVLRLVRDSGGKVTLSPLTRTAPGDRAAILLGRAVYYNRSRLHFLVVVDTSAASATYEKYKFHLMSDDRQTIFRYDDSPRHRNLATFPHHKHVGASEAVVESGSPDIAAIIAEVRAHVEASR